jgi:MATE family multidrug resistance protein
VFICLAFGKDWIVDLFLKDPGDIDSVGALSTLTSAQIDEARGYLLQSLIVIGAYVSIENIRCLLYGVLRAAGDTVFILILSVMSTWSLLILPTYQLFTVMKLPVYVCFWVWLLYAATTTGISYLRFTRGNWNKGALFGDKTA